MENEFNTPVIVATLDEFREMFPFAMSRIRMNLGLRWPGEDDMKRNASAILVPSCRDRESHPSGGIDGGLSSLKVTCPALVPCVFLEWELQDRIPGEESSSVTSNEPAGTKCRLLLTPGNVNSVYSIVKGYTHVLSPEDLEAGFFTEMDSCIRYLKTLLRNVIARLGCGSSDDDAENQQNQQDESSALDSINDDGAVPSTDSVVSIDDGDDDNGLSPDDILLCPLVRDHYTLFRDCDYTFSEELKTIVSKVQPVGVFNGIPGCNQLAYERRYKELAEGYIKAGCPGELNSDSFKMTDREVIDLTKYVARSVQSAWMKRNVETGAMGYGAGLDIRGVVGEITYDDVCTDVGRAGYFDRCLRMLDLCWQGLFYDLYKRSAALEDMLTNDVLSVMKRLMDVLLMFVDFDNPRLVCGHELVWGQGDDYGYSDLEQEASSLPTAMCFLPLLDMALEYGFPLGHIRDGLASDEVQDNGKIGSQKDLVVSTGEDTVDDNRMLTVIVDCSRDKDLLYENRLRRLIVDFHWKASRYFKYYTTSETLGVKRYNITAIDQLRCFNRDSKLAECFYKSLFSFIGEAIVDNDDGNRSAPYPILREDLLEYISGDLNPEALDKIWTTIPDDYDISMVL